MIKKYKKEKETEKMDKKDKEPPAEKPRGESKAEKQERERLKKINRIPDYEALYTEEGGSRKGNGLLKRVLRRDRGKLLYSSLVYIIKASPIWIMPLVTGDVIDLITGRPEGYLLRVVIDAIIFAVMVAQNVPTNMWYSAITNKMIRNTTAGIKSSVIRKLQRLSITYHREMEGGKIQSKFLRDIDNVDMYYRNVVQVVIPNLIGAVISVIISLQKSPLVTLFFVAVIPLNILNAMLYRKKMRRFNSRFRVENEKMSAKLTVMLQMLSLTKAHGLETSETVAMRSRIDSVTRAGLELDKTNASFGALTWVIGNLLSGLCFFFCVFLALKDIISTGEVVLFQSLFASINGSVLTLINVYPSLMTGKEAIDSLSEIMRAEDMEHEGGARIPADIEGRVDFEDVSYRYPDGEKDVIKDFTLHVRPGECIAFVGSSGSGKSTIINLLIGLLEPTQGDILIDGVSLNEISIQNYRHFISVVPQNSILFSGTIRENITYGLDRYSEEELQQAVEDADIPEFLPSLPDGLNTQVGEHGDKLSGGQKQRICIARALIRHPRILIMDEATSALDNVAEYHVQKAVGKLMKVCTTFIVAHRLSTIRNADRIVVMEEGKAVEMGTYDDLMALNGKFAELEHLNRVREESVREEIPDHTGENPATHS